MSDEIQVKVIKPASRRYFLAQWIDPVTGLVKTESTRCTVRRDADRYAGKLQEKLNNGEYRSKAKTEWAELRRRYTTEVSASKAPATRLKTQGMWNAVEELLNPRHVQTMADPNAVSMFGAKLREPKILTSKSGETREIQRAEYTIAGHLAELRKVLRWAAKMRMIREAPYIALPETIDGMKGRAITDAEYALMVAAVDKVERILPEHRAAWLHYLEGLWLSGLRRAESMQLHWTDERHLCVDLSGRRPMMKIQARSDKGRKFRMLPITPDFSEFLLRTPKAERTGFVFNPFTALPGKNKPGSHRPTAEHVGRIVSECGELAGVKVNDTKFASAHDFRRAFGFRWALLVMPKVLQELMRHRSIQTTMEFYVGDVAASAADATWQAWSKRESGNTSPNTPEEPDAKSA